MGPPHVNLASAIIDNAVVVQWAGETGFNLSSDAKLDFANGRALALKCGAWEDDAGGRGEVYGVKLPGVVKLAWIIKVTGQRAADCQVTAQEIMDKRGGLRAYVTYTETEFDDKRWYCGRDGTEFQKVVYEQMAIALGYDVSLLQHKDGERTLKKQIIDSMEED